MFNIMNLNNIENIFYWTDNNGAVSLPGDTALTYRTKSDLPRFVAAVYSALNTDSGVSERVVTLNGHCGLLLDVLYDKDWVSETFSNLNCEIPDEIIMNLFGAALPCLAQIMWNDIHIEDKEIEGLRKHLNPDGVISQLLNNVQKARAEKGIDEVESRVKQVETQIRLFLRTPEIENEIKDIETAHLNEESSFDCGFIFWYPKADSQLEKDMSLLVGANRRKLSWLDIAVPTFSQSINVQRYGAELIKKLVKERLGIELYYRSELD